jgi:hypothetical protein
MRCRGRNNGGLQLKGVWFSARPLPRLRLVALFKDVELWNLMASRMEMDLAYQFPLGNAQKRGEDVSEALKAYTTG